MLGRLYPNLYHWDSHSPSCPLWVIHPSPFQPQRPAMFWTQRKLHLCLAFQCLEPCLHSSYNSHKLIFPVAFSSIKKNLLCELHKVSYSQPLLSPDPNSLPFRNVLISKLSQNIIAFPCSAQQALALAFSRDISLQLQ